MGRLDWIELWVLESGWDGEICKKERFTIFGVCFPETPDAVVPRPNSRRHRNRSIIHAHISYELCVLVKDVVLRC